MKRKLGPTPVSECVRRRMQRTPRRDTDAELLVRSLLHAEGFRYRVDVRPVPTLRARADLVFRRARVAVFVDGCFWHGCPEHGTWPKNNAQWWRAKIEANRRRDERATAQLRAAGWTVVRVWEHEAPARAAARIRAVLGRRV
jgi:DNA mismatch endonuclease, patch repair protein